MYSSLLELIAQLREFLKDSVFLYWTYATDQALCRLKDLLTTASVLGFFFNPDNDDITIKNGRKPIS